MKIRYVVIVILVSALVYGVFRYATREKPVEVTARQADRGLVESTVANTRAGTVRARHRARLAPAIGGLIATLDVQKGDHVKKGQILLTLWNNDLQAQLELAGKEAKIAEIQAKETCLTSDFAERNAARLAELLRKGSTSEYSYDEAKTTAAKTKAGCERSRSMAVASKLRIETIQAQLEKTIVRAPFAGIVAEVNGEIGEFITPSPTGVATLPAVDLISLEDLYVAAPIDEMDAAQIRVGMVCTISLDAFVDQKFDGSVLRIAPYVLEEVKQARTVEVECGFTKQSRPENLLAGYSADAEIILDTHEDVLRIPSEALLEDSAVYILDKDEGRIIKKQVRTGLANWRFTEVVSGLQGGDWIVTSLGRKDLKDGAAAVLEQNDTPD